MDINEYAHAVAYDHALRTLTENCGSPDRWAKQKLFVIQPLNIDSRRAERETLDVIEYLRGRGLTEDYPDPRHGAKPGDTVLHVLDPVAKAS